MSLFNFRWLYKIVRKRTKPISEPQALIWKKRLSIIYMLSAWQVFGILIYFVYGKKQDWGEYYGIKTEEELHKRPAVYFAELLGVKKAHVIDIKNFKIINEYQYNEEKKDEDVQKNKKDEAIS